MSPVWGLLVLVVLFMMGMPVAYAIGISSVVIMAASTGIKWVTISSAMIQGLDSFTILCIPLFLLSGKLMNRCGITDRLFTFCRALVGWFPGGLGHVNVLASFIFAGMSGTAVADAAGLGQIEIRAMEANGYDRDFSAAVTAASSTLGPLIPPSLVLVVYGMVSGESVGALFMAGILPGVVMALLMMGLVTYYAIKNQYPRDPFPTGKQVLEAFRGRHSSPNDSCYYSARDLYRHFYTHGSGRGLLNVCSVYRNFCIQGNRHKGIYGSGSGNCPGGNTDLRNGWHFHIAWKCFDPVDDSANPDGTSVGKRTFQMGVPAAAQCWAADCWHVYGFLRCDYHFNAYYLSNCHRIWNQWNSPGRCDDSQYCNWRVVSPVRRRPVYA